MLDVSRPLPPGAPGPTLRRRAHGHSKAMWNWGRLLWAGLNQSRSLGLAAQTAFWLFFSLLPLAAVGGLILARVAISRGDVSDALLTSTPPAVRGLVATQLGQVANWNGGAVAPVAAVVFVWLASSGIHAMFDALEVQAGLERPWWKKRLLALASCVGLSLGIATLALLRTGLGWLFRLAGTELPRALAFWQGSFVASAVRIVFGALLAFGLIAALYAVGTPRRGSGRPVAIVPGALLAVTLQALGGFGYGTYVRLMGTGNAYQAGLGIVGVTLMCLYLASLAVLVGAKLNQAVTDRRASTEDSGPRPAAPRLHPARHVVRTSVRARVHRSVARAGRHLF